MDHPCRYAAEDARRGVHLPDDDNGRNLRKAVEEILGKAIESGRPTQTL